MIVLDDSDLLDIQLRMRRLASGNQDELLDAAADLLVVQTKRRIAFDKSTPQGEPWAPWSPGYARTRGPEHSLGVDTGEMLRGVAAQRTGRVVRVGSDAEHAVFFHSRRAFLGVGDDDKDEIARELDRIVAERLAA